MQDVGYNLKSHIIDLNKKNKDGKTPLIQACSPPYTDVSDRGHYIWLDMKPAALLLTDRRLKKVKVEGENMMTLISDLLIEQCKGDIPFSNWRIVDPDQILHFVRQVILRKECEVMDHILHQDKFIRAYKVNIGE